MKYGLALLFCILLSCSEDNLNTITPIELNGKWVEVEARADTLLFSSIDNSEIMRLNRGKEIRNGHLLPKSGSGTYHYSLAQEKISLNWMLSSNSNFKDYYFKIMDNKLVIGNFYDAPLGEILTFERLD